MSNLTHLEDLCNDWLDDWLEAIWDGWLYVKEPSWMDYVYLALSVYMTVNAI